ncbi:hypothetical protein [Streptomyces sp. SID5643]|uniref:hypothetical protein n=1 Tax=Streptomyces sp. SID5643 TaxID=2690307 RepID=UPI0013686D42|nr:hypothetical protein [Streptomyces sp. SID5643]MZF89125.1 hypothetical protein [Streptomyces sp. SID5643]
MGIRTFLSRTASGTASGVALSPVPAFEAAASTVRVPVTFTSALRHATTDLRRRLSPGRRRLGSTGTGALPAATALAGADDLPAAPLLVGTDTDALAALTGLTGTDALSALTGLTGTDALSALTGLTGTEALTALVAVTGNTPAEARPPCAPEAPGKSRPWTRLARDYLTLVLTLLPRPRPAHTTITVYITADSTLSERPGGSAPSRRQGQEPWGPEPDAAP